MKLYELSGTFKELFDRYEELSTYENNAESVEVINDIEFINWAQENKRDDLLKYEMPTIRKTPLKKELQQGAKGIPGVSLTRTRSLIIK